VETLIFEANEPPQTTISPELLDRLSRNLFDPSQTPDHSMTAADALITLLGSAARLDVPLPGGARLVLDKKGARDVKKQAERDGEQ
jgi:hypothetical protein